MQNTNKTVCESCTNVKNVVRKRPKTVRQFPVVRDKGCKNFKDKRKQSSMGKIASTMAMEMVTIHLSNLFLIQLAKLIAGNADTLRI